MTLQEYKKKSMQDPEFVKAYEDVQPEINVIIAIIEARTSQNMTFRPKQSIKGFRG